METNLVMPDKPGPRAEIAPAFLCSDLFLALPSARYGCIFNIRILAIPPSIGEIPAYVVSATGDIIKDIDIG